MAMNPAVAKASVPRWLSLLALLCWGTVVQGATVEGVELPGEIRLGEQRLQLNGAGVREKFFFDIYVAGLYLEARQADAGRILSQDRPWRMVMHFLYKKVGKEKLADGWEEGFEANLDEARMERLRPQIDRFKALFPDLHRGDEVLLDHLPGGGVKVTINGRDAGTVGGSDFASALLGIWLGERPVTRSLKADLLGGN